MTLYVDENKQVEVELSKFDKKLFDLTEKWEEATGWDKVAAQYDFVAAAFGGKEAKAYLKDRLGGTSAETVDLMELGGLFMELQAAYDEVIRNTETAIMNEKYKTLGEMTENLTPVINAVNAVENMTPKDKALASKVATTGREAFKRIK